MPPDTEGDSPSHEQIETRAYEIYLSRGENSSAVANWLAAEDQLRQEHASAQIKFKAASAGERSLG
jgi:hypothetical protein